MEMQDLGLKRQGGFKRWTKWEQNSKKELCVKCPEEKTVVHFRGVQVKPVWLECESKPEL